MILDSKGLKLWNASKLLGILLKSLGIQEIFFLPIRWIKSILSVLVFSHFALKYFFMVSGSKEDLKDALID